MVDDMPENRRCPPEGTRPAAVYTLDALRAAAETGEILEAPVERCAPDGTLTVNLGCCTGRIPRAEAVAPWISGADRPAAVTSRVGKLTCFTVQSVEPDGKGGAVALLSRRDAQERTAAWMESHLAPGAALSCTVVGMERYGAFLDIGRGIVALLPLERIAVSRVRHPKERFRMGQRLPAVLWQADWTRRRFTMSHRELLGTWLENASGFRVGETVPGLVRDVRPYGCFIELTPNLSGLSEPRADLSPGGAVSVNIRSLNPERRKVKLRVVQKLPPVSGPPPLRYRITDGVLSRWTYAPPEAGREPIETVFREEDAAPEPEPLSGEVHTFTGGGVSTL